MGLRAFAKITDPRQPLQSAEDSIGRTFLYLELFCI